MAKKINKFDDPHESLVEALESIKSLLAKSDSKLAAARKSIAIASNQTALGKLNVEDAKAEEIPVLNDIVIPADAKLATEEASKISKQITSKIEATLSAVSKDNPILAESNVKADPKIMLNYLDTLQTTLEKGMRDSLMKSIVTIEAGLKKNLKSELDKIRKQIKKDFK